MHIRLFILHAVGTQDKNRNQYREIGIDMQQEQEKYKTKTSVKPQHETLYLQKQEGGMHYAYPDPAVYYACRREITSTDHPQKNLG